MSIKRKFGLVIAAVLLAAALAFTGCSGDDDDTGPGLYDPYAGLDWGKIADWENDGDFVIGSADATFDGTNARYQETALGNLLADGIKAYAEYTSGKTIDLALHNGQNIRVTELPAGEITNSQITGALGTDILYVVTYTGEQIETIVNTFVNSSSTGRWNANCAVIVSKGVSYTITGNSDPAGQPTATNIKINGAALVSDKDYLVAIGNFIGNNTDESRFPVLDDSKKKSYDVSLTEAIAKYIYAKGTITPVVEGRITGVVPVIPAQ
jgi:2',3'-cyclic-nucleotide 2'-phosphodiesterase (5'-nucleotidase family)